MSESESCEARARAHGMSDDEYPLRMHLTNDLMVYEVWPMMAIRDVLVCERVCRRWLRLARDATRSAHAWRAVYWRCTDEESREVDRALHFHDP